jgi:hypothetical protein
VVDTIFVLVSAACYSQQIVPAAANFSRSGDTAAIVGLLRKGQLRLRGVPPEQNPLAFPGQNFDQLQDALNIIEGREFYGEGREFYGPSTDHKPPRKGVRTSKADLKSYIESQVYDLLFWSHCVTYSSGVPARLVLTRGRLLAYLYEHSSDLENAFIGALRGKPLPLLPSAELLANDDLASIAEQLNKIPIPNDDAERRKAQAKWEALANSGDRVFVSSQFADSLGEPPSVQLNNLKQMLNKVLSSPDLAIVQRIE